MKKVISILTATRAEYGLLKPVIERLMDVKEFDIRIVVTGTHLSKRHGMTYKEIADDKFAIDKMIDILDDYDTSTLGISKIMGNAMIKFSEYFSELNPDLLIVLGDRYETLAVCCVAMNENIPIAHLYGGETTEGAVDEAIRHSISKMSYLHFTSTQEYRRRVIQLGEAPERVFCVGATGIENIKNVQLLSKRELEESIEFQLDRPYGVITFHPVTLESSSAKEQFTELLNAIGKYKDLKFIITKANADADGDVINEMIDEYVRNHKNVSAYASLGVKRYLSVLKYSSFVLGNSSSGIIEAPSFRIPTINIGNRQAGRIRSDSVIDCQPEEKSIIEAIQKAMSDEQQVIIQNFTNPYGEGDTSEKVVSILKTYLLESKMDLKKKFYNIEFKME